MVSINPFSDALFSELMSIPSNMVCISCCISPMASKNPTPSSAAFPYSTLDSIVETDNHQTIVVRLLRTWEVRDYKRNHVLMSVDLLLLDEKGEKDDNIIAVCVDDPEYKHYTNINELPPHRLSEIRRFFEDYKKNDNKEVAVNDFLQPGPAIEAIQYSMDLTLITFFTP